MPHAFMRLPGTINVPDQEKKAEGRSPTVATVLTDCSSRKRYSVDELRAWAPPIFEKKPAGPKDEKLPKVDMAVVRAANGYSELPAHLCAKFENACVEDPVLKKLWDGEPTPWQTDETGSGFVNALAWLLKGLGTFTVNDFGQLVWVWSHASAKEKIDARYIARTWARANPPVSTTSAFEPITPPEITELNQKHAVIANIGGKCRVLYWEGDKAILQSFGGFRNRYSNPFIQDGTRRGPPRHYSMRPPERRQYDGLVF